jgi:hypothetical protein
VVLAICVSLASIVITILVVTVPRYAHQRGHGFISWFVLQILTLNPIYLMLLLATLPNRARSRLRDQFAGELDAKLKTINQTSVTPTGGVFPAYSIGGIQTAISVGEMPTSAPDTRSMEEPSSE